MFLLFVSINLSANAVDLMCKFEEYNVNIPDVKAHDLHIHIKFDDNKNTISYVSESALNEGKVEEIIPDVYFCHLNFRSKTTFIIIF